MFERFNGNVVPFADESTSTNRTVFGSETQSDDIDDNLNADFKKGWEIVGLNDNPTREDFNAMGYTLGYLTSYLYQNGVAEYNLLQEYKTNSIAIGTDGNIYQSLVDNNLGNALTDTTKWVCIASKNSIVNSIDELKTISNIESINALGYYEKGDGGGGTFYWDATSTETDNGGTIIQATGITTGRWKRVFSGAVNVKWFGVFSNTSDNVTTILQYIHDNFDMILNDGTYIINELIINSYRKILGAGENRTILKWDGSASGVDKSVVRASKSSIGVNPTSAISFSLVKNLSIDATGCDYGLYTMYCTNESRFENITAYGASKSNISILKSWFAKYINLTGKSGVDKGISIAFPLSGETGDLAVNACYFENIRAYSNGTGNTYNITTNPSGGAGVCVGSIFRGSLGTTIQSEQNGGAGLYTKTSFPIAIGFLYLEANCTTDLSNKRELYIETTGNYSGVTIDALYLTTGARIYTTSQLSIGFLSRNDNTDTFINTGVKADVNNSNLGAFSNTDFNNISSIPINIAFFPNINTRYSSALNNTFFYTDEFIIPYIILIPRATVTMTNTLSLKIDTNASANYGTVFTQGVPIKIRHSNINAGVHLLSTSGSAQSVDNYCDIIVIHYKILPNINRL